MLIFAIDPGTKESGVVIAAFGEGEFGIKILEKGVFQNEKVRDMLITWNGVDAVACEEIRSYGMSVGQTTFDSCRWIGRFEELSHNLSLPFFMYPRKGTGGVCQVICLDSRAKDGNIKQALIDRFSLPGKPAVGTKGQKNIGPLYGVTKHAWSALAVATTHFLLNS